MMTKALICVWIASLSFVSSDDDLGHCEINKMKIGKYTLASSDADRDLEFAALLFPMSTAEHTDNFHQGECAKEMKVFIPGTCFKIHAPQTRYASGYLSVNALEQEYTKKFYAVIHSYSDYDYDAFFDNNMGFWVRSLDPYFTIINDNHHLFTSYIGLKWDHNDLDKTFYSLIIQSPDSQIVFELMSLTEPDLSSYPHLRHDFKWQETFVPRASFKQFTEEQYPWNDERAETGNFDIIPVRISYATANINEQIDFYVDIMEAELLDSEMNVLDSLDSVLSSYAFLRVPTSLIEVQYIQRPNDYTYGAFTVETYSDLIIQTHKDLIAAPYCGIDRWLDNHYGIFQRHEDDLEAYEWHARVLANVIDKDVQYLLYWTEEKGSGQKTRIQDMLSDDETVGRKYKFFVVDNNGHSIQMIGFLINTAIDDYDDVPQWSKEWCNDGKCANHQHMQKIDEDKVYVADESDIVSQIINLGDDNGHKSSGKTNTVMIVIIVVVSVVAVLFSLGLWLFGLCKCFKRGAYHTSQETQPLLYDE